MGGFNFNFEALNPLLGALTDRWGRVMDIQTERLADQPARERDAYQNWDAGQRLKREETEQGMKLRKRAFSSAQAAEALERRRASGERTKAENEKRASLLAEVDRNREMQARYGMTPFTPAGTLADWYSYGGTPLMRNMEAPGRR